MSLPLLLALVISPAAGSVITEADGEILFLTDGRFFEGVDMSRSRQGDVTLHFENGDVVVPAAMVDDALIKGGDAEYVPQNDEERVKIDKGFVRFEGKWMKPSRRDRLRKKKIDEQRAIAEEAKEIQVWRNRFTVESKEFLYESTVPRNIFARYQEQCEAYFEAFKKTWKIKRPRDLDELPVKFYVDNDKFVQITGMSRGVGGFFQFVPPLQLHFYYDRENPRWTELVIYHELGHYLQKLIDVDFKYPHWPGESLCEYYGGSVFNPDTGELIVGLVQEHRLIQIKREMESGKRVGLRDMILGCQNRNYHDYSWGWSLVHYLMTHPTYEPRFKKFFLALANGRDVDRYSQSYGSVTLKSVAGEAMLEAFMKYMKIKSDDDLNQLEKDWYDYIESELHVTSWRGLATAGEDALRQGRRFRAERLLREAVEAGAESPSTFRNLARLLTRNAYKARGKSGKSDYEGPGGDGDGEADEEESAAPAEDTLDSLLAEARKHFEKAIEIDPLGVSWYISYGDFLLDDLEELNVRTDEDQKEGQRVLKLAQELDPDNSWLKSNLKRYLKK